MTQYLNTFGLTSSGSIGLNTMGYIPFEEEWNDNEFGIPSADSIELFDGLEDMRTIYNDIQQIESSGSSESSGTSITSEINDACNKYEIRNRNCMWSGLCSYTANAGNNSTAGPAETTSDEQITIKLEDNIELQTTIKIEPSEVTPQIPPPSTHPVQSMKTQTKPNMQNIPPGTSLLIHSRLNQQRKQQNRQTITIPTVMTSDFVRDRELATSTSLLCRPDTPLSLDDDAPEFKHTVDLAACITGSNNISLGADDDKIMINKLKEQLEDPSTERITVPGTTKKRTLTEVLSVIENQNGSNGMYSFVNGGDSIDIDTESDSDYDYEEEEEEDIVTPSKDSISFAPQAPQNASSSANSMNNYPVMHSDHSYTRSKDRVDVIGIGLETPSDSDEEIDVVSIGDKKLPTNPSDKDRRALQTKVAHKISARIVKTPNGVRTIPPRRRISYETPYTPASISPVKSVSSLANSRYQSPTLSPSSSTFPGMNVVNTKYYNAIGATSGGNRKRSSGRDEYMPPNKRHRGKKQKSASPAKRHYSVDEADTIEKRNLHNDMERQRRIGLKNLFEALKKQIPSIKDKERAPKVNILREAAKLCEQMTQDDTVNFPKQKQILKDHLRKRQEYLNRLKAEMSGKLGWE